MAKKWVVKELENKEAAKELAGLSDLIQPILIKRGLTKKPEVAKFLEVNFDRDIHDPFLLKGMTKAVERIKIAISNKEKIIIFADYDADGVPGAAILSNFFTAIGYSNFEVYIPDRHTESYGLKADHAVKFAEAGAKLIITIDCGITAAEAVEKANELKVDVIITDHHLPPDVLPAAYEIINPKRPYCSYPFKELCGAGVIYKVVCALEKSGFNLPVGFTKWLLDLVAISTVSDMMPLVGENRVLVKYGLLVLNKTKRPGLLSLFRALKLKMGSITEDDIGFSIGPRLNAASRMLHAREAYKLLITNDEAEATNIALELEKSNKDRRKAVDEILEAANEEFPNGNDSGIVVVGAPHYNLGVLGLASGRLSDKYQQLVFVWGQTEAGEIKGSCRSPHNINVVELMKACPKDLFIDFGGHAKAGGFSLIEDNLDRLATELEKALKNLPVEAADEEVVADGFLDLSEVTLENFKILNELAPFGKDNPKPVFWLRGLKIRGVKTFGSDKSHLELKFETEGREIKAISFFSCPPTIDSDDEFDGIDGHHFDDVVLEIDRSIDLLACLELSTFGFRPELRLRVVDIRSI